MKHPALRVPPGGNQVDGLPPAFISDSPATFTAQPLVVDFVNAALADAFYLQTLPPHPVTESPQKRDLFVTRRAEWLILGSKSNTVSEQIFRERTFNIFGPFELKSQFLNLLHPFNFDFI